ncbi:MAG: tetratricopeptide repeat protein [Steroidobacteraceae bacterium]
MRKTLSLAPVFAMALLAVGSTTLPGVTLAADAKGPTVSKALAKPLKAAQEALGKKDWKSALAKLDEADAVSGKTPYDQHLIAEMRGFAYVRSGNYAEAAKNLEAGLNSGFLAQDEIPTRVRALSQIAYQTKNYAKAIEYGNRAIKGGFADADIYTLVGQAYYVQGDYKGTLKFMDNYVDSQVRRGETPKKQSLELILSSCVKMKDDACTTGALERLVKYYPTPEYWQNIMYSLFRQDTDDKVLLNTFRLAADVDALKRGEEYTEMAQLAIEQGTPGEAVSTLEKAFAKNIFTEPRDKDKNQRLLEAAKKSAATDQAALGSLEAEAAKAKTGGADVGLGKGYLSYGQYDKAATALQRGIGKGGLSDKAEVQLLLGIAQLKSGKKDDAIKSFNSLKDDAKYGRLAGLWAIHARS